MYLRETSKYVQLVHKGQKLLVNENFKMFEELVEKIQEKEKI